MPTRPGKVQFISWTHREGADLVRKAHSHAARAAHARERRLRVMEYQAAKAGGGPPGEEGRGAREESTPESMDSMAASNASISSVEQTSVSSPRSLLASGQGDPFSSFASPFRPIEHFLLYHYVTTVLPFMQSLCIMLRERVEYLEERSRDWVQLALSDAGSLKGVFLAASRHLSKIHQQREQFLRLTLQYKVDCVRALRHAISAGASAMDDTAFAKVIILAADELFLGNIEVSRHHVRGAVKMVELMGGPRTLGLGGFLEHILYKYVGEVGLAYKFEPPELPSI